MAAIVVAAHAVVADDPGRADRGDAVAEPGFDPRKVFWSALPALNGAVGTLRSIKAAEV
jgi:hypothetical protein